MHDRLKTFVLGLCKVPPEPSPPRGSSESVRVFRASPNFYKLSLVKWGFTQAAAILGILTFIFAQHVSPRLTVPFQALETIGAILFLIELPFTYFLVRLDFEMRWYIVTDRSLRIRHGVLNVREMTMTFANIQQITVHQGPLQRLLGISDLQVQTAGGGSGAPESGSSHFQSSAESMHVGFFRGVDNAEEIRDLMIARLRKLRDAGLGDPDDIRAESPAVAAPNTNLLEAAREVLAESRTLRHALAKLTARG
ncbi:MAG: PH domain-containing protein [Verrucomicrobia bacterium]|nr:PH domain-containing protein [Verrucomicrobiota bacterium]